MNFPREQTICSDGFNVERVLPIECELHHKACLVGKRAAALLFCSLFALAPLVARGCRLGINEGCDDEQ